MAQADTPLPLYAHRCRVFADVMEKERRGGDDPKVIVHVIVAVATDSKPKLR